MAQQSSFDVTTGVDLQEVDNAVNQAQKEITQRYDFKGSPAKIELQRAENKILLEAEGDYKMTAVFDVLQSKLIKRGVSVMKKVQASIQGEQVRITSPSKDELQDVMTLLRSKDFGVELKFGNYR